MNEFFLMSGYGTYVWSAYFFAFIILSYLFFSSTLNLNKKQKQLDRLLADSD